MELAGWINEKLFDAFLVGTVPIYRGAPDVHDYIPDDCFIDARRFETCEELEAGLRLARRGRDRDVSRQRARFHCVRSHRPFTKQAFAELLVEAVEEDLASRT